MTTSRAGVAHVLRRTTFGPFAGAFERIGDAEQGAVVDRQLEADPVPFTPTATIDGSTSPLDIDVADSPQPEGTDAERARLGRVMGFRPWWVRRMLSDEAGLHEKMMWFWHGHFTTSSEKVDDTTLCWRQLRTLHTHALGNFAELATAMTVDGAMLKYLDGASSVGDAPNENYAREFMELFTLGFGKFRQSDVLAAARVFAGYTVTNPGMDVVRVPENCFRGKVTAFGIRRRFTPEQLIEVILDQDDCAPFVVRKLWRDLIGGPPDADRVGEWAREFRRSGYEIAPLLARMLHSAEFAGSAGSRPRTPIEWYCAAMRATGDAAAPERDTNLELFRLGQSPYLPPSVAGWPDAPAWLSPTQAHARAMLVGRLAFPAAQELADALAGPDPSAFMDAVADRCGVAEFGPSSTAALRSLASRLDGTAPARRAAVVLGAALLTPEMSLS